MKAKGPKIIKPKKIIEIPAMQVEIIRPNLKEKFEINPTECKFEILTTIPLLDGHIRCIVLKEHQGMFDLHKEGDIIDLPERRFKSESFRGIVQKYEGEKQPNKRR